MMGNSSINNRKIYERKLRDFNISASDRIAIYGTGVGADMIFEILEDWGLIDSVVAVVDNDNVASKAISFHGFKVESLDVAYQSTDCIIISAMDHHETVFDRVKSFLKAHAQHIRIINVFGHNTNDEIREYVEYLEGLKDKKRGTDFVEYDEEGIILNEDDPKIIAWYLPQFHRIDINDKYHGRGFTEWTNTSTAMPMFSGHYQPHVPYDVGYYDLNNMEIMYRQAELAKHYGIYGFSFYYYWFSGKRIMEKPLESFIKHTDLNMNFCITWANENWSTLWDGGNKDLIFEQRLSEGDDIRFINDAMKCFSDTRYIKVGGKYVLLIYNISIWKKDRVRKIFEIFRSEMHKQGMGDLYIMLCNVWGFDEEASEWGADALVEFPPHGIFAFCPPIRIDGYLHPGFNGQIRDTQDLIANRRYMQKHNSNRYYRAAFPYWDNTARKAFTGATVFNNLTPETFERWMTDIIEESKRIHSKEDNIVFVNAWNEWAEGAHLEPDIRYGYANLSAVKKAIKKNR